MNDQPGGGENEPVESKYEPAMPPTPMGYDQALAAARQAGDTAEPTGTSEPSEADQSGKDEGPGRVDEPAKPEPVVALGTSAADEPAGSEPEPDRQPTEPNSEPEASGEPTEPSGEPTEATPVAAPRTPLEGWLGRQPEFTDDEPPRRASRRRRALIVVLAGLLTLSACTVGGAWWLSERYAGQVHRIPRVFDQIPEQQRPDKPQEGPAAKALNFLLAGTDRRSDLATTGDQAAAPAWVPGAQRSDTIILVHLTADRKKAYVISFPRDSWVDIPGHGMNKINAAFSLGGPPLYVQTLEHLTGVRIDHLAIIDWDGFIGLTNALGGVDVTIPQTTHDSHNNRTWEAGMHHLYGEDALDYVRQRYGLPRGDFDRVQRQQNFLREIMRKTLDSGTLSNPLRLARVLDAVTRTVSVDDTMSNSDLRGLALSLRGIRQGNVTFMTAPTTGTGYEGSASVVYLDQARAQRLYDAIKKDDVDSYLARFSQPDEQLGTAPA